MFRTCLTVLGEELRCHRLVLTVDALGDVARTRLADAIDAVDLAPLRGSTTANAPVGDTHSDLAFSTEASNDNASSDNLDSMIFRSLTSTVDSALYWQEPRDDAVLASVPVLPSLRPIAQFLSSHQATGWWSNALATGDQNRVHWLDESPSVQPQFLDAAGKLQRWKQAAVEDERRSASRPRDPAAPVSGAWWSIPALVQLVTSTSTVPMTGYPAGLALVEDGFGWEHARVNAIDVIRVPRVYEITGPSAWTALVARYPLTVTLSKRHDWWRATGLDVEWVMPDWLAVAEDFDTVNLTVFGYLTTAGQALLAGSAHTVLAGWNPDQTYWLADVVRQVGWQVQWRRAGDLAWWTRL